MVTSWLATPALVLASSTKLLLRLSYVLQMLRLSLSIHFRRSILVQTIEESFVAKVGLILLNLKRVVGKKLNGSMLIIYGQASV